MCASLSGFLLTRNDTADKDKLIAVCIGLRVLEWDEDVLAEVNPRSVVVSLMLATQRESVLDDVLNVSGTGAVEAHRHT